MAGRTTIENGQHTRQRILETIISYIESHGYPPTIREIGEGVGLSSTSSVMSHIKKMLNDGMLETDSEKPGAPRALRVPGYKFVKEEKSERSTGNKI